MDSPPRWLPKNKGVVRSRSEMQSPSRTYRIAWKRYSSIPSTRVGGVASKLRVPVCATVRHGPVLSSPGAILDFSTQQL